VLPRSVDLIAVRYNDAIAILSPQNCGPIARRPGSACLPPPPFSPQGKQDKASAMTRSDLRARARQRPFRPFRLVLTDGQAYDVRHPDFLMVGRDSAVVGVGGTAEQDYYETTVLVDLLHITRLEPLEQPTQAGGQGDGQT
jgi:hypothetical protein